MYQIKNFFNFLNLLIYLSFLIIIFFVNSSKALETEWSMGTESQVRLISPISSNNIESEIYLGLEYKLEDGWKTYWQSPGDGGFPQKIKWNNSSNVKSLDIQWPTPKQFEILGMQSIGYSNNVIFPLKINLIDPDKETFINLDINYLVCKDICIPGIAHLEMRIPVGIGEFTDHSYDIEKAISKLPIKSLKLSFIENIFTNIYIEKEHIYFELSATSRESLVNPSIFLLSKYGLPVNNPELNINFDSKKINAKFKYNKELITDRIINLQILIADNDNSFYLVKDKKITNKNITKNKNLIYFFLVAFLGGLILNAMPCVLPVLSIKILSLINHSNKNKKSVKKSFLFTALGIICSFSMLAILLITLKYLGYSIGWGIQFQEPIFLMFISLILSLFAFNLFGFFELKTPNIYNSISIGKLQNHYYASDFFNGFFATLMATPCSAPFVGTALTIAFTQSAWIMLSIFIVMGIGMSTPYLMICLFPRSLTILPKPGKWMLYVKYFLAYLVYLN